MDLKYDGLISIATGRSRKETLGRSRRNANAIEDLWKTEEG